MIYKILLLLLFLFSGLSAAAPPIRSIKYDGNTYKVYGQKVDPTPLIQVDVFGSSSPSFNSFKVVIDGVTTYTADSYDLTTQTFSKQIPLAMSVGFHSIQVQYSDTAGSATSINQILVEGTTQAISGPVYAYPSPATSNITFEYSLVISDTTTLRIYNMAGVLMYQVEIPAGSQGARAGSNQLSWNLQSGYGSKLANGVYIAVLTTRGQSAPLKKAKFLIYR